MRISQLSERAGLPVGTVKFYLRTGLLPAGRALNATQAEYEQRHLERLRLIRALIEVGRLSVAELQQVLGAIDGPTDTKDGFSAVQGLSPVKGVVPEESLAHAREVIGSLGWTIADDSPQLASLARSIDALTSIGLPPTVARLKVYAEAASHVARSDVDWVSAAPETERVTLALANTVLWEALLDSLRRLAVENQLARRAIGVPGPRLSIPSA